MSINLPLGNMTLADKLEAMETLWADISRQPADLPSPVWHRDVLHDRRRLVAEEKLKFLDWDTAATAGLLEQAGDQVDADLAQRIAAALGQQNAARSLDELEARNGELRGLLVEVVSQLAGRPEAAGVQRTIRDHLLERTRRYPFRMAIAAPTSAKG